jgi:hypothetical protein
MNVVGPGESILGMLSVIDNAEPRLAGELLDRFMQPPRPHTMSRIISRELPTSVPRYRP